MTRVRKLIRRRAMWLAYAAGVTNGQYSHYFTKRKLARPKEKT